jgi:serine/threonine-protein phosphatase 2A regulatory subunit B
MMSSDEGQIFLWSLEQPDIPYMLVNYAPKNDNEEQGELITCSDVHPTSDSLFVYGMSKGTLKLADLRVSSNTQSTAVSLGENGPHKNYIYELLSSYSDVKFARMGSQIVTRDCLSVKVWDVAAPKKPLYTVMLNDGIKSKLCEMVENESIFDKFQLACSPDSSTILSGSYNNTFHMVDPFETNSTSVNSQY